MKRKGIEIADISRFRGELMGLAILFVMLFHVGLPRTDMFFGLHRIGNIGVDMFFFLSGVGLWHSWTKILIQSTSIKSDFYASIPHGLSWHRYIIFPIIYLFRGFSIAEIV